MVTKEEFANKSGYKDSSELDSQYEAFKSVCNIMGVTADDYETAVTQIDEALPPGGIDRLLREN